MQRASVILAVFCALGGLCLFAPAAHAREATNKKAAAAEADAEKTSDKDDKADKDEKNEKGDDADKDEKNEKDDKSDQDDKKGDAEPEKAPEASKDAAAGNDSPVEEPGKTYYFVGLRYRGIVVPQFIQGLFASGGATVYVNAIGPEFAIRKDNFEYNLSPWLAFYSMGDTGFKGKSDKDEAWELINANITMLYLTSDFLWSHNFTPELAINYGLGAGFGFVFGSLHRVQSFPTVPGQSPDNYSKCAFAGQPTPFNAPDGNPYCDGSNNHFGNYSEPSWANGGSKPILFPWLVVQTGLRFKPSRTIAARLDIGFGTSGFFFGLGGDYGL
jgi:hypothetical protein